MSYYIVKLGMYVIIPLMKSTEYFISPVRLEHIPFYKIYYIIYFCPTTHAGKNTTRMPMQMKILGWVKCESMGWNNTAQKLLLWYSIMQIMDSCIVLKSNKSHHIIYI